VAREGQYQVTLVSCGVESYKQVSVKVEPGRLQFSPASYAVREDGLAVTVTVTRTGSSKGAASVDYSTADGSAKAGQDYVATSDTLSWADGDMSPKPFIVDIIDDALPESNETVQIRLSNPRGATISGGNATLTILNDDTVNSGLNILSKYHPVPLGWDNEYTLIVSSGQVPTIVKWCFKAKSFLDVERCTDAGGTTYRIHHQVPGTFEVTAIASFGLFGLGGTITARITVGVNPPGWWDVVNKLNPAQGAEFPNEFPRPLAGWRAKYTLVIYDSRGNAVQGPDEEDRWLLQKEIWFEHDLGASPIGGEHGSRFNLADPDQQGKLENQQTSVVTTQGSYQHIVQDLDVGQIGPGDEAHWPGFNRVFFRITRYNGSVVEYQLNDKRFFWNKNGPKGTVDWSTYPPKPTLRSSSSTVDPETVDDLRMEFR